MQRGHVFDTRLFKALLTDNPLQHVSSLVLRQSSQHCYYASLRELNDSKKLRLAPLAKPGTSRELFGGLMASEEDYQLMIKIARGGDWIVEIRRGKSLADGSLPYLSPVDRAKYGDLQVVFRSVNGIDNREVILRKVTAPMGLSTRRFFDMALCILPLADIELIVARHSSMVKAIVAERPTDYEKLDNVFLSCFPR